MMVRVKVFGPQSSLVGRDEVVVDVDGAEAVTCAALRERLAEAEPRLAPTLTWSRFAVNHEYAEEDRRLEPGDEVALIGMVSGG